MLDCQLIILPFSASQKFLSSDLTWFTAILLCQASYTSGCLTLHDDSMALFDVRMVPGSLDHVLPFPSYGRKGTWNGALALLHTSIPAYKQ